MHVGSGECLLSGTLLLQVVAPLTESYRVPTGFLFLPRTWLLGRIASSCHRATHAACTALLH